MRILDTDVCNAAVVARHDLNDDLSVVRVRPDYGTVPPFEAGQFIMLGLPCTEPGQATPGQGSRAQPRLIRRAYSIASPPRDREALEFLVVRIPDGELTPQLWTVGQGGRVWIGDKIQGKFTLEPVPPDKDLVMVSTGTGIAPYMSMLREYRDQGRWRRLVMINGTRSASDLGYRRELEHLSRRDPTLVYIPLVTREQTDSDWTGLRGRVQQVLEQHTYRRLVGARLDPQRCHVFLCGNPAMIKETEALLHSDGFKTHTRRHPGSIHYERYW